MKLSKEKDIDVVVVVNCLALGENCIASAEGVVGCMWPELRKIGVLTSDNGLMSARQAPLEAPETVSEIEKRERRLQV